MSEEEKPPRKRKIARRPAQHHTRRKCPFSTFEKIMPYVDAIEHYHLAHAGEGITVSEFRMADDAQKFLEQNGGTFADTYVVSGKRERRLFRQLADMLRYRNEAEIQDLIWISKLEQPVALPPAANPDQD